MIGKLKENRENILQVTSVTSHRHSSLAFNCLTKKNDNFDYMISTMSKPAVIIGVLLRVCYILYPLPAISYFEWLYLPSRDKKK